MKNEGIEIEEMNDYQFLLLAKARFGNNINCDDIIKNKYGNLHVCPACEGKGYVVEEYNGYPSGLPDSGWAYTPAYRKETCDVCGGKGFTEKEMVPNMVQQGWKVKE